MLGLAAPRPSFQGRIDFRPGDVLLHVALISLRALAVALQTCTKYTLTENSYIHDKGLFLHKHTQIYANVNKANKTEKLTMDFRYIIAQ